MYADMNWTSIYRQVRLHYITRI